MTQQLDTSTLEPSPATHEKHGSLFGGALTEEALTSSRKVLSRHRGSGAFAGLQQWFTPLPAAQLIAAIFGRPAAVLDPTAGSGALLAPYPQEARFGMEIDQDHIGSPSSVSYNAVSGDAQAIVPMLRAAGACFPAIAMNPPFGLSWRDPIHARGEINSTVLAYLWAMDLLDHFGQGALVCGRDRLRKEILSRKEGGGIYAIVDVDGPLFDGVALPTSIAFFVRPHNREKPIGPSSPNGSKGSLPPVELSAAREELPDLALKVVGARSRLTRHVSTYYSDARALRNKFEAVVREHERRRKQRASKKPASRFDLDLLKANKVRMGLSAYAKLALAEAGSLREIELLSGQHTSYFAQNTRAWRQVEAARDKGLLSVSPTLEERVAEVLEDAERQSTPLFPVKPQQRLGWLTDLERIRCKKDDPSLGFLAGEDYSLSTHSKVVTETERRLVEKKNGDSELRQFEKERKLLAVRIGDAPGHIFDESSESIEYLTRHFELPDPGCVATRFPDLVADRRQLLKHIARKNGFKFKLFQLDHYSRLLVKERGMLAHEQGLGKCVAPDTPVLINGALVTAGEAWCRFASGDRQFDGEGEWSRPTVDLSTTALNSDGNPHDTPISRLYRQRVSEWGRRITLDDGSTITITNQHKLLAPSGWTLDVEPGDRLCVPRNIEWEGRPEDKAVAELLAWQIAEGYENPDRLQLTITQNHLNRLKRLRAIADRVGASYRLRMNTMSVNQPEGKTPFVAIWSRDYQSWLENEFGYQWGLKRASRTIPNRIVSADKPTIRVFLRAFLAAEASASPTQRIVELTSASRLLMDQISLMLRRFGIWLRISKKTKNAANGSRVKRPYYTGIIGGRSLRLLNELVGIDDENKARKLEQIAAVDSNDNVGSVPVADVIQEARRITKLPWLHLTTSRAYAFAPGGASPDAARRIAQKMRAAASENAAQNWRGPKGKPATARTLQAYEQLDRSKLLSFAEELEERADRAVYYARVICVERVRLEGYVYDFEVADHHNYVAGGMMAHNTLGLMALAEATVKLGAREQVLFVAPQDLLGQWAREAKKFFGRRMEEIRTPAQARDVARRIRASETGWWITYYEALSIVGRKREVLPHVPLDHRDALSIRLEEYKRNKKSQRPAGPNSATSLFDLSGAQPHSRQPAAPPASPASHGEDEELEIATTRVACPECRATTYDGWNGEVCRDCGYTHRKLLVKSAYSHLTRAFKPGVKCVDEVSEIRGDDSLRSKAIRGIAAGPHNYGATGTPLSNYINDSFWGLWFCLGNASPAFPYAHTGGKAKFETDFCVIEYMNGREEDGEEHLRKRKKILPQVTNVSQFWRLVQPGVSRCRKEQTGEPLVERTYHPIRVPMGVKQAKANDFWLKNFEDYFVWKNPDHPMAVEGLVEKWAAALGQLWRLETVATLPASDEPSKEWPKARAELGELSNWTPANLKVLELAMEHAAKGEKVLIGSDLILTGKWLAERLCEKGVRAVHITEECSGKVGTKNPRKRAREVEQFVEGDVQVLCVGIGAMKLGHNLDVASTVIVHGLPYSFMSMDQFIARVHRLTSKREVSVYVVIPRGSLAERKWTLLKDKGGASDLAFDGELSVQPEKPINWYKVLKEMKERGIRSSGDEVLEADVKADWEKVAPLVFLPPPRTPTPARPAPSARAAESLPFPEGEYVQAALF